MSDDSSQAVERVQCEICERTFRDMSFAVDHMEQAHALVTNVIERNTTRITVEEAEK